MPDDESRDQPTLEQMFESLFESIVGGDLAPGDRVPSETELADAFGVSIDDVRAALDRLARAGMIHTSPIDEATLVSDYRRVATPDMLGELFTDRHGELNLKVMRDIVEARSSIGPSIVHASARRATRDHLTRLDVLIVSMRDTTELDDPVPILQRHALEFWDLLVDAADNVVYRLLFNTLRRAYEPLMDALSVVMAPEVSDVEGMARVVDAVRDGRSEDAADAIRAHTAAGTERVIDAIDWLLDLPDE